VRLPNTSTVLSSARQGLQSLVTHLLIPFLATLPPRQDTCHRMIWTWGRSRPSQDVVTPTLRQFHRNSNHISIVWQTCTTPTVHMLSPQRLWGPAAAMVRRGVEKTSNCGWYMASGSSIVSLHGILSAGATAKYTPDWKG
jgi:hypothetical protein